MLTLPTYDGTLAPYALQGTPLTPRAPRVALIGGLSSAMEPWLAPDVRRRLTPVLADPIAGALHLARSAVSA